MSKSSSKQKYVQLMSWLSTIKKDKKTTGGKKESRLSYYEKKGFNSKK